MIDIGVIAISWPVYNSSAGSRAILARFIFIERPRSGKIAWSAR